MKTVLGLYHLVNRVEYSVVRSDKKRFDFVCKYKEQCLFLMRASGHGNVWKVFKWKAPYSCHIDLRYHSPRTVSSKVIGANFAPTLLNEGAILRPKYMQSHLQRQYGVVDYQLALAGRNHAIKMIYGDKAISFQLLRTIILCMV